MIRKLQVKFVIINMAIVTVMLCAIFALVYHFTRVNLEAESIGMMKEIASEPIHLGRPSEQSSDLRLPYFTLHLGPRGEIVSTGGGYYDLSDKEFLNALIDESVNSHRESGVVRGHDLRFFRVAAPTGTVLVFSDMSSENNTLDDLMQTSLIIGALSFLAFLVISIFLSKWAVKPVAIAWQQQKQFVADASHELKTPLTVIMTNAELLHSDDYSQEEHKTFSHGILAMSRQMKALLEKMLELAKSDAEQTLQQPKSVDLSNLIVNTILSFEGLFAEKGLTLESTVESEISVRGCEQSLQQVTEILLDNAQKYSSSGSETAVRLYSCGHGKCRLSVSNPGKEIPPEDLQKIFRRFYRTDRARSRDGSFGLGLSIAENIITQHKGRIWAESKNGINTFFVELRKGT